MVAAGLWDTKTVKWAFKRRIPENKIRRQVLELFICRAFHFKLKFPWNNKLLLACLMLPVKITEFQAPTEERRATEVERALKTPWSCVTTCTWDDMTLYWSVCVCELSTDRTDARQLVVYGGPKPPKSNKNTTNIKWKINQWNSSRINVT